MNQVTQSIRQRLLNISRNEGSNFQELVQYFTMNRFLSRLAQSEFRDQFILKGAFLMHVLNLTEARSTMDIDLLGKMTNDPVIVKQTIQKIIEIQTDEDGLSFGQSTIKTSEIAQQARYPGVRVELVAKLGVMLIPLKVDIGFGDTVYPQPILHELPSFLGLKSGEVFCYQIETSIAEKAHTMLFLEDLNSRMKDFYDIWLFLSSSIIDAEILAKAIAFTFRTRKTEINLDSNVFSESFRLDTKKQKQWEAFVRKRGILNAPPSFSDVVSRISSGLKPIIVRATKLSSSN